MIQRRIEIRPLVGTLVRIAYPFASALGVDDPESWQQFVASFTSGEKPGSGAVAAQESSGYVGGLLFHQTNRHRARAPVLVCDPLLVAELPGSEALVRALLAAADRIAVEQGCKWVRVVLPASGDPIDESQRGCGQSILRAGFALEGVSFRRRRALPMCAEDKSFGDAARANR